LRKKVAALKRPLELRKHVYQSGATYEGEWLGGLRHGQGTMQWPDGTIFTGTWQYNAVYGEGMIKEIDCQGEDEYHGHWHNNMFHGKGIYVNKDGRFEGTWFKGKENGQGKMTWSNGSCFEGNYVTGVICGFGVYKWPDGTYYKGLW
jgi:hypothetical protein